MSNMKLIQYTHRPNTTELGMGNTHETYMLVNADTDLSSIFPPAIDVKVRDVFSDKQYTFKSASGREFRVNQMGELYRDYNILPGDEIIITKIEKGNSSDICVSVKQYPRVVLVSSSNGFEVINIDRIEDYLISPGTYAIKIYDRGVQSVLNIRFDKNEYKRKDSPNQTAFYSVDINGNNLANGTYYLTLGDSSNLSMLPKSEYGVVELDDSIFNATTTIIKKTEFSEIDANSILKTYLAALRTKPFMLLAGISGTGKSRIVRKLAQATTNQKYANDEDRWMDNRPENFELIQVKPNWHNSMDVVGFYSNISKKYEFTPFVEFIVKAWQNLDTPYFLCLDEMNLAPVEEYFAEFLSAIESRTINEKGEYITDPIIKPFNGFDTEKEDKKVSDQMISKLLGNLDTEEKRKLAEQFRNKGLTLPQNLMVMGTVNMDETTFTFSRKVLDRAMSVEMNEVDYDKFLSGESDLFPLLTDINELLVKRPRQATLVKDNIEASRVVEYLKAINVLLDGTPFKLGYRAANEAILYVSACQDFEGEDFRIENALDEFTLMKILSRIEGDDNRLAVKEDDKRIETIGMELICDQGESSINLLNCLRAIVRKNIGFNTETEKKINSMYRTLDREHFVSYWA